MSGNCTHYELLGISRGAPVEDIKTSYQRLALVLHPDKCGGSREQFQQLQQAWQTLRDPHSRALYDHHLSQAELRATVVLHDEIDLDDMDTEEHSEQQHCKQQQQDVQQQQQDCNNAGSTVHSYPCRCGDNYRLTATETYFASQQIILPCRSCSNAILVRLPGSPAHTT